MIIREDLQRRQEELRQIELAQMAESMEDAPEKMRPESPVSDRIEFTPLDAPLDTYIETESARRVEEESPTQRMIVLSNKGATETHLTTQEEDEDSKEPVDAVPDDFVKIAEFKAGGVAAVNRKSLLKQRSENLNDAT